jgi:hypothetical protein
VDREFWENLIRNMLQTFAVPELTRRQAAGRLPPSFDLYALQVIMEVNLPPEIRFNEEVTASVQLREGTSAIAGEHAVAGFDDVIDDIISLELADDDRPNAGHITMIRCSRCFGGWWASFDLRYNGTRTAELLRAAREFLDAAKASAVAARPRAAVADLFASVELLAKSHLLLVPDAQMLVSVRHEHTRSRYNRDAHLGNADRRFAALLNELSPLRNVARYSLEPFHVAEADLSRWLALADEMMAWTALRIPPRALRAIAPRDSREEARIGMSAEGGAAAPGN